VLLQPTWTSSTLTTLLSEQAITGIIAVALVLPFAAGAFDLSFAYNVGFGAILAASLIGNHAFPSWAAIIIVLAVCGAVGAVNGFLATAIGINPGWERLYSTRAHQKHMTAVITVTATMAHSRPPFLWSGSTPKTNSIHSREMRVSNASAALMPPPRELPSTGDASCATPSRPLPASPRSPRRSQHHPVIGPRRGSRRLPANIPAGIRSV
jgi:hypothetical protein